MQNRRNRIGAFFLLLLLLFLGVKQSFIPIDSFAEADEETIETCSSETISSSSGKDKESVFSEQDDEISISSFSEQTTEEESRTYASTQTGNSERTEETTDETIEPVNQLDDLTRNALPSSQGRSAPIPPLASAIKFVDTATFYRGGIALDSRGKVWSWGYNTGDNYGAPGISDSSQTYLGGMKRLPFFVKNDIHIKSIYASYATCYALDDNGNLYGWGYNLERQLGEASNSTSNYEPLKINIPNNEKVESVYTCASESIPSFIYIVTESKKVYAWGYGAGYRIKGAAAYQSTPLRMPDFETINIKKMVMGNNHGLILDMDGNVHIWGSNAYGMLGQGNPLHPSTAIPFKMSQFAEGSVKDISAYGNKSVALTTDGEVYQWGLINTIDSALYPVNTPTKVAINTASADYTPEPVAVYASLYSSYFLDSLGRSWVWGYNNYYQTGEDGPLTGKLNAFSASARQQPVILGDGDTQNLASQPKAPVFSGIKSFPDYTFNSYRKFGQWSALYDGLHPTIYDKKYCVTTGNPSTTGANNTGQRHDKVYLVDNQGRKLVYVVRRTKNSPYTYYGDYYVANGSYNGSWIVGSAVQVNLPNGVTEERSVPIVKESEQTWIGLAVGDIDKFDYTGRNLQEMPYVEKMACFKSAATFLDPSGNIYRTSLDGSGTIAWGWDFSEVYESESAGNNKEDGLYNYYNYEIMFMRGAPRVVPGNISLSGPQEKQYQSIKKTEIANLTMDLGTAHYDPVLNFTVEPKVETAKFVLMPYDSNDPNMQVKSPTKEQFEQAYNNAAANGSLAVDLAEKNGWKGIVQKVGQEPIVLKDDFEVEDNCVAWVMLQTSAYVEEEDGWVSTVKAMTYDNFYTEALIKHQGVENVDTSNILYEATDLNVTKETNDGIDKLVGFPLDKNGVIIGKPETPPTFGYDQVKVAKLTNPPEWSDIFETEQAKAELVKKHRQELIVKTKKDYEDSGVIWTPKIETAYTTWVDTWIEDWVKDEWLPKYKGAWAWHSPQAESKVYELNGVPDATNNEDLEATTGKIAVCKDYIHSFHYDRDKSVFAKIHYLGVDDEGENLPTLKMTTEEVLRDVTYRRIPPELLIDEIEYYPIQFKLTDGQPTTTFPLDITGSKDVAENNEFSFKVPAGTEEATVNIVYKCYVSIELNVRQVIKNPQASIKKPSNGFFSVENVKLPDFDQKITAKNIVSHSGPLNKTVPFSQYVIPLEKGYKGVTVKRITPQYYHYLGHVVTEAEVDQDISLLNNSEDIQLNCDRKDEYWLTIYLEPETKPNDHAWDQQTNDFGTIKIP